MLQTISPYMLLCASKPKPPRAVTTQYDLYSLAQSAVAASVPAAADDPPVRMAPVSSSSASPAKKTHYISDIHARHTAAMRRTPQSPV